jgi:predicted MFS family arabinose efflux permease
VQGVGGAAMLATSLALLGQEFRGPELPGAIAAWSAAVGAGVAAGPLAGGVLTETLGWRSIFLVNVPISVVVVAVAATQMTNVRSSHGSRLDLAGLVTFSGGLCALVYALLRGNADGWSSPGILAAFAAAAVLAVAFVVVERRRAQPMFDLGLFRNRAFAGVSFATAAIGCGVFSMMLYLSLYMQDLLGLSALEAGVRLLGITLPVLLVPLAGARVIRRLPQGAVLGTGLAVAAAGLLALRSVTGESGSAVLLPGLVAVGVGIGLANPAIGTTALRVVDPARSGMASGISNTCRMAGFATGIAVLGALFEHGIATRLDGLGHGPVHGLAAAVAAQGPAAVPPGSPAVAAVAHQAFLGGLREILLIGAVIALTGAVAAFTLIRSRDFHRAHATQPAQPPPPLPAVDG